MSFDAHKNFAVSTIVTAPSPATSGTSLTIGSGDGIKFPAVPFNATIWPALANPTNSNAEIVRVTAISTDTLTITRAQELTTARTIVVGDSIAATITAKTLTDVEAAETMTIVTLTDGATPALNAALVPAGITGIFRLTAAGDRTIGIPSNPIDGQKIIIEHTASGAIRTLALNTGTGGFLFGSDITALTQTASGKTDAIGAIYHAATNRWRVLAYSKGF